MCLECFEHASRIHISSFYWENDCTIDSWSVDCLVELQHPGIMILSWAKFTYLWFPTHDHGKCRHDLQYQSRHHIGQAAWCLFLFPFTKQCGMGLHRLGTCRWRLCWSRRGARGRRARRVIVGIGWGDANLRGDKGHIGGKRLRESYWASM